jgi:hypothetical protein
MKASTYQKARKPARIAVWRRNRLFLPLAVAVGLPICGLAQTVTQSPGLLSSGNLIVPSALPDNFAATLQKMGGRMMNASVAQVTLTGTTTDSKGSRAAQIVVQAPGFMSYREGTSLALTFNGTQWGTSGPVPSNQEAILESFLAHFPDVVCLQIAGGGIWRRLGSHFRTVAGNPSSYAGPYWTMWEFSPTTRPGLTAGQALQQNVFVAIDESSWLISEVRVVTKAASGPPTVIETQFNNWVQQNGQWCPGQIVRLEGGQQVLSFQTAQCSAGVAAAATTFIP